MKLLVKAISTYSKRERTALRRRRQPWLPAGSFRHSVDQIVTTIAHGRWWNLTDMKRPLLRSTATVAVKPGFPISAA
jgi:hypothetical protein